MRKVRENERCDVIIDGEGYVVETRAELEEINTLRGLKGISLLSRPNGNRPPAARKKERAGSHPAQVPLF